MSFAENRKDKTFAFTTFSPFKSLLDSLGEILVLIAAHKEEIQTDVRKLKFLHYAHFTRVPPRALRRAGLKATGRLRFGGFLFNSAYNGDAEAYFRGFSDGVADHMNDLWSTSTNWVSAKPYQNLATFIHRYQRAVNTHVNAYPSYSLNMRTALEVRTEVERLVAAALEMSEPEFEREFRETAQQLWGNAP